MQHPVKVRNGKGARDRTSRERNGAWMLRLARYPWTFQTKPLVLPMRNVERIMFIHPGTTYTESGPLAAHYLSTAYF
jgi:hypothetical protein